MEAKNTAVPMRLKLPATGSLAPAQILGPKHPDGGDYAPICEVSDHEIAAFIVRACNAHDALVKALQDLLDAPDDMSAISQAQARQARAAARAAATKTGA